MRIHIPSLPHTETTRAYDWCAYTAKVRKFATMMHDLGHTVFLYAGTHNEARCTEHVSVVSVHERETWWPTEKHAESWDGFQPTAPWWRLMNFRVVEEMGERVQPGDVLGIIAGWCQEPIARAFSNLRAVEWGIGYEGVIPDTFHIYESYAWMHYIHGAQLHDDNGRFYDTMIPNSFDEDDLEFSDTKDDYLLYLGRVTPRKGIQIAVDVAHHTGRELVVAGQGEWDFPDYLKVDRRGIVLGDEKADLLARAHAVLIPTLYLEPFGGVAVEAMMSGTPVITTDFGAFTETVVHGETGFRCSGLREFVDAVDRCADLVPHDILKYASGRYSTTVVAREYDQYFGHLTTLDREGWYEL